MRLRPLALVGTLAIASIACSEMTLAPESSSPNPKRSAAGSQLAEGLICAPDDHVCHSRFEEQRHQLRTEAKLEELRQEEERSRMAAQAQHDEQIQQQRAAMIADGKDPDAGSGFWCFSGQLGGKALGECRRTEDECIDQFLRRDRAGLQADERKCTRSAQAACFQVTRTLQEGARDMCFDAMATCDRIRETIDPEGFISPPSECAVRS